MLTSYCLWIDLCIVVPCVPYVTTYKELKKIKSQRGWVKKKTEEKVYVDTKAIPKFKEVPAWFFVVCAAACLLPLLWEKTGIIIYICFFLTEITYGICCRYCYRNKAEMVDENTELTIALTQIRKYNWSKTWVVFAVLTAVLDILQSLVIKSGFLTILIITLWTILIGCISFKIEFKVRKLQEKLTADCGLTGDYVDDDDYWIGGLIYYNPNDSKLLVNNRAGMGTTFNMARPFGKFTAIFVALILVLMPFTGKMISFIGNTPIVLEYADDSLIIEYGSKEYLKLRASEIQSAELVDKLPENLSRSWGTAADNLLKGSFTSDMGNMNLCLDPNCPPFVLITKTSGNKVLFGGRNAEETLAIFEKLQ